MMEPGKFDEESWRMTEERMKEESLVDMVVTYFKLMMIFNKNHPNRDPTTQSCVERIGLKNFVWIGHSQKILSGIFDGETSFVLDFVRHRYMYLNSQSYFRSLYPSLEARYLSSCFRLGCEKTITVGKTDYPLYHFRAVTVSERRLLRGFMRMLGANGSEWYFCLIPDKSVQLFHPRGKGMPIEAFDLTLIDGYPKYLLDRRVAVFENDFVAAYLKVYRYFTGGTLLAVKIANVHRFCLSHQGLYLYENKKELKRRLRTVHGIQRTESLSPYLISGRDVAYGNSYGCFVGRTYKSIKYTADGSYLLKVKFGKKKSLYVMDQDVLDDLIGSCGRGGCFFVRCL